MVLEIMDFRSRWLQWIKWCISTTTFSVLVNSFPTGFFRSTRGLRQGDPLSPYLFMIGMEVVSRLIGRAMEGSFLFGCNISGRVEERLVLTHLLYADDTLIFCGAYQNRHVYLRWLLMWFEAISGLRINLSKIEIIHVGKVDDAEALAIELGRKVGSLPTSYLGLLLGAPHNSIAVWDPIEERFRKRLALWKRQFISKGGRTTLIRSTLSSMPIYFMCLLRLPRIVKTRLERV